MSESKKEKFNKKENIQLDERFSKVKFDPRFSKINKKELEQKIPSRLTSQIKNSKAFTNPIEFDKYGRKYKESEKINFEQEKPEDGLELSNEDSQSVISSSTDSYVEGYFDEEDEVEIDAWEEESDENKGKIIEPTPVIAVENFDFRKIKGGDLMVLFNSFKPAKGVIKKIQIYLSTFGKERLEIESREGPGAFLNTEGKPKNMEEEEFERIKLREYEKSILKYYFAIVQCDSKDTADEIFQNLDGSEFELTGMCLKISFVPTSLKIPNKLIETCTELPESINFDKNTFNRALAHTNINFSWDEPKQERTNLLSMARKSNLEQKDLNEIIGGIEDSEGEEYIINNDASDEEDIGDWKQDFQKKKNKSSGIEITFKSGFDNAFDKEAEKELKQQNIIEERQKEKKTKKRNFRKKKNNPEAEQIDPTLQLLVDEDEKEEFTLNLEDPRFSALHSSKFAIDSTSNKFKKEKMKNVMEGIKKKKVKLN